MADMTLAQKVAQMIQPEIRDIRGGYAQIRIWFFSQWRRRAL